MGQRPWTQHLETTVVLIRAAVVVLLLLVQITLATAVQDLRQALQDRRKLTQVAVVDRAIQPQERVVLAVAVVEVRLFQELLVLLTQVAVGVAPLPVG